MGENNKPCTAYLITDTGERVPVEMENLPEITPSETDKLVNAARALAKAAEGCPGREAPEGVAGNG